MRAGRLFWGLFFVAAFTLRAQDFRVTSTKQVLPSGGRVTWGAKNNLLAYDRVNAATGYYDVYTSNPDGSNEVCLSCSVMQFPYSKGNPEWHPSNNFLAVQIQWQHALIGESLDTPGAGVSNDLYIMDAAGQNYWPVTQNSKGVLHPRFSHNGSQLLWVERTFANNWQLMLADFAIINGVPQVTNVQSLRPCQNNVFCETGGFSLDDSAVYFTHSGDSGISTALDIYSYNLATQVTTNLTHSQNNWNEFPTSFPFSNRILWMSGTYGSQGLQTDYWMMDADGSNKTQLTYYNYSAAPSWYLGAVSTAKFNWSPDGTQIAAYFIPNGTANGQTGSINILSLEPAAPTVSAASFARPPLAADSIVSTFYPNLATATAATTSTALPNSLAGTTATVTDAQNSVLPVPFFFVSPGQINFQVPTGTASGPATLTFSSANGTVSRATINIELAAPGIFTAATTGAGPAAAYLLRYAPGATAPYDSQSAYRCARVCATADLDLGASTDSAYLVLFGTGLRHAHSVSATVAGQLVPISYRGPQLGYPGLDQVNILLPHQFAGSGAVSLLLYADEVSSNAVQISIR